mgnify:CR=1 FL=1
MGANTSFHARKPLWIALRPLIWACAFGATGNAMAQTVIGPGTLNNAQTPIQVPTGQTTLVNGSTTVNAGSNAGTNVNGGTLTLDEEAGPETGPIVFNVGINVAMNATLGGRIFVPNGILINVATAGSGVRISNGVGEFTDLVVVGTNTANAGEGVLSNPLSTITLGGATSISMTGNNSVGIGANTGGTVTATAPVTINAGRPDGFGAFGVYLYGAGALVDLPAGTIVSTSGRQAVAVTANAAVVPGGTLSGLIVNLGAGGTGAGSTGVLATAAGDLSVEDLVVQGPNVSAGAWAQGPGSTVRLSGASTITVTNAANPAFNPLISWTATGDPVFSGLTGFSSAAGLLATQGGNVFSSNTTINVPVSPGATQTPAAGAHAANTGSSIDMTGNTITTTGTSSFGLRLDGARIVARDSQISTSGGGAAVFINSAVSSIDLTNTTAAATGAGTAGLFALNFAAAGTNTASISGGALSSAEDVAIGAVGPLDVTVANAANISGAELLRGLDGSVQPTLLNVTASGASRLQGDAFAQSASTVNLNLAGGTVWTGASDPAEPITNVLIDSTSTWVVTRDSVLTRTLTNAGLVDFNAPVGDVYKSVTVRDYVGQGGTLALNTFLEADDSPSDRLVIDTGAATGTGLLRIKPTGGAGAVTTANGILVVEGINGGATQPDMFALASRVVAGPYEYTLQRSGIDGSAAQNWFLRSTIDCSAPGAPVPPCPEPPPPPPPDPDPDPDPTPDPDPGPGPDPDPDPGPPDPPPDPPQPPGPPIPNYRDEVSLYSAAIPTAMHYGRAMLDTLHERVGEQELLRGRTDMDADRNTLDGMWGRLMYVNGERDSTLGIYGEGPSYDYVLGALQLGYDLYRREEPDDHRDHAGLYGAIGYAETDVDHYDGTSAGDDRVDAYTLGGYWTRYGVRDADWIKEWYVDTVVQATWYEIAANPGGGLPRMETDGWGFAASLEGGYPFRMRRDWILEPQAQVIYQWFDIDDASDEAATVRFDDTTSLVGRLSARLSRDWVHADDEPEAPLLSTFWSRASVWHEFRGEPVTSFSSDRGDIPFAADLGGTWWELELGGTRELDRNVFLYGNVGYSQGFDDDRRAWEGKLGLRANW